MFVKATVVLYELRLKRLKASHEVIHDAHRVAFGEFYSCSEELAAAEEHYNSLSSCVLRAAAKELIDAAGGRRSASWKRVKKCERAEVKNDRKSVRMEADLAKMKAGLSEADVRQKAPSTSSSRSIVAVYSAALQ